MTFPVVAGLILSLVVRYWPGRSPPQWIGRWIDRLWLLLAITFLLGMALAFFNESTTVLPNGGVRHTWSTPQAIRYVLAAIYVPLGVLAVLGTLYVVRSEARAFWLSLPRDAAGTWATLVRLRRIAISLAIALAAAVVSWQFGGPLTLTSGEGYTSVWPFVIDAVAAVVFFTALASAWSAAKSPSHRP
jgi:hypothetical protein